MVVGLLMSAFALLTNQATVLYTFYPPMMAVWFHYVGLTLVVVGSWVVTLGLFFTYWSWRTENPGVTYAVCGPGFADHLPDVVPGHAGRCRPKCCSW